MEVFRRIPPQESRRSCALSIGNFDGVHLGHQAMLKRLKVGAEARGLPCCVLTFEPHPREFFAMLRPEMQAPARIYGERDKIDAMAAYGVDRVCIAHFNESMAAQAPEHFIEEVLIEGLQTRHLLIGDDFRFGAKRVGDFSMLQRYADQGAFSLERMDSVLFQPSSQRVSSSLVRQALNEANFDLAEHLLGRKYCITGHVIHGKKLGRTLGFPTLNLKVPSLRPALRGIFVVKVFGLNESGTEDHALQAVASLGTRPAIENEGKPLLEVHVLDYRGDAYGKLVRVEFLHKLRDEGNYTSLELLTAQIQKDAEAARAYFNP